MLRQGQPPDTSPAAVSRYLRESFRQGAFVGDSRIA